MPKRYPKTQYSYLRFVTLHEFISLDRPYGFLFHLFKVLSRDIRILGPGE